MMSRKRVRRELEHNAESKLDLRTGRGERFVAYMFTNGAMPYLWLGLFAACLVWSALSLVPTKYYVHEEVEFPDRLSCQVNTIVAQSLALCHAHPNCNLGDEEMIAMYMARKKSLIDCKRADLIDEIIMERARKADPII